VDEAELLIAAPAGEMWQRGDLGQSVYMLLIADPRCDDLLEELISRTEDHAVRWHALQIKIARAGESGLATLDRLTEKTPTIQTLELYGELRSLLLEHGHAQLW
jgi:hypothetical protein